MGVLSAGALMHLEDTLYPLLRLYEAAPQAVKSLAGRAYRALPEAWRQGSRFEHFKAEASASEYWDEETRRQWQAEAVKQSLLAAMRAPFHAARFAERGRDATKFESLEQLADYPLLTKADLLTHREEMVNPDLPASARLYLTTGGSSGVPVGFYLHKGVSRPKEQAYLEAQWRRRGYQPGAPTAVLRGALTSRRADGAIAWYDPVRNWLMLSSSHLTPQRLPEYLAALRRFQPLHLHAYPSAALLLAKLMIESGTRLECDLTSVLCGSEKLDAADQAFLERHFQAPVFHWYGHSERAVLAGQGARSNHLYFWPAYGYAELGPSDAAGRREVIATSFHNHVMPLIRYRTGDYVTPPAAAERELPMLEIAAVAGRDYEFLVSGRGRRLSLTTINRHDDAFDGLLALQFVQERAGEVEFRYQAGSSWHQQRLGLITKALRDKLGDDFELRLKQVDEVEKTTAGKHRWLITSLTAGGWS